MNFDVLQELLKCIFEIPIELEISGITTISYSRQYRRIKSFGILPMISPMVQVKCNENQNSNIDDHFQLNDQY